MGSIIIINKTNAAINYVFGGQKFATPANQTTTWNIDNTVSTGTACATVLKRDVVFDASFDAGNQNKTYKLESGKRYNFQTVGTRNVDLFVAP